jgi:putative tricarboxylic transport membrane protein
MTAGLAGIVPATVGIDPLSGTQRMASGIPKLLSGLDVVPVLMGLFGIAEVLYSAAEQIVSVYQGKLGRMLPRGKELTNRLWGSIRGTAIGITTGP